jgi:hypothetical protein
LAFLAFLIIFNLELAQFLLEPLLELKPGCTEHRRTLSSLDLRPKVIIFAVDAHTMHIPPHRPKIVRVPDKGRQFLLDLVLGSG